MPKISVIIPVYNVGNYLAKCLDSVLNQTFGDFEAICVNDGSTDNCASILEEYARKDSRIKVISQENQGVASARNNGLQQARGEYVSFLDSDDEIAPQFFEKLYRALQEHPEAQFAWCQLTEGLVPPQWKEGSRNFECYTDLLSRQLCRQKPKIMGICTKLYRKELLQGLFFEPKLTIGEDLILWFQLLSRAKAAVFVPQTMYFYRCRPDSATRRPLTRKRMDDELLCTCMTLDCLKNEKMDAKTRKMFYRYIAKQFFYIVTRRPPAKDKAVFRKWLEEYLPVLRNFQRQGLFRPRDLSLKNRIKYLFYRLMYQK